MFFLPYIIFLFITYVDSKTVKEHIISLQTLKTDVIFLPGKDYDDLFSAVVFAATGFYAPDSATFLTPHAHSLMYLHSFLLSLISDTQPVIVNQMQYLSRELQETTKNLPVLDPSVRDLFSTITQFDCQARRDALSQLVVIDDSTYGIDTFADWIR